METGITPTKEKCCVCNTTLNYGYFCPNCMEKLQEENTKLKKERDWVLQQLKEIRKNIRIMTKELKKTRKSKDYVYNPP